MNDVFRPFSGPSIAMSIRTVALHSLVPALLSLVLAAPAAAQVVILGTDFGGELTSQDEMAFRQALFDGLERADRAPVISEAATRTVAGETASCRDAACMAEVTAAVEASVVVTAEVYAEAEIYDYTVRFYDGATGALLSDQVGDCTFCPLAEAIETFSFTAEAGLASLPEVEAPAPVVVEVPEAPAEVAPTTVAVLAVPNTSVITVDGVPVGADGRYRDGFAPGAYEVEVAAPGHRPYQERVNVTEAMAGSTIYLRVVLAENRAEQAVETVVSRTDAGPSTETLQRRRAMGGVAVGSGVALAAVGATLLAIDGNATCPTGTLDRCPSVYETTAGGAALLGIGGIGIGTGVGLLLSTLGSGNADGADTSVSVGANRVGIRVQF